jgi:hypothetical protein
MPSVPPKDCRHFSTLFFHSFTRGDFQRENSHAPGERKTHTTRALCVVFLEKQGKERTGKLEAFSQDAGGHGADVDFLSVVNFACEWRSGDRKAIVVHADSVRADFTRSELGRERVPRTSGYFDRQIGRRTCAEGTKIPNEVKAQTAKTGKFYL